MDRTERLRQDLAGAEWEVALLMSGAKDAKAISEQLRLAALIVRCNKVISKIKERIAEAE